jgi:hypothetical protein
MSAAKTPTAIEKRAQNRETLAPFGLHELKEKLPLVLPCDPTLPPSPKPRYRSAYRHLGVDDLNEETLKAFSPFEIAVRLFDYSSLEPLLAAHIYVASAKGQVPFDPVSWSPAHPTRNERENKGNTLLRWHAPRGPLAHALLKRESRLLRTHTPPLPCKGEKEAGM